MYVPRAVAFRLVVRAVAAVLALVLLGSLAAPVLRAEPAGHCSRESRTVQPDSRHEHAAHAAPAALTGVLQPAPAGCAHCAPAPCALLAPCGSSGPSAEPGRPGGLRLGSARLRISPDAPAELRSRILRPPTPPPQLAS